MNKTLDTVIASLIAFGLIIFLIFLGTRADVGFDPSYNLLSYQNLFEGKGFVYDYDGRHMPFDPGISAGPELYLPVFVIWKIVGHTDYYASVYVIIAYYAAFLGFLLFYTLRSSKTKTLSVLAFIFLFLCNRKIFWYYFAVVPLGEIVACFYIFAAIYLMWRKKLLIGFLLFGLALDVKTNIIVALVPTIAIFIVLEYILPKLKEKNLIEAFKNTLKLATLSLLILIPYLTYSKIIPTLALNSHERAVLQTAQQERFHYLMNRGFGHSKVLEKNFNRQGFRQFISLVQKKMITLKGFFLNSSLLAALFFILLIALILFSYYQRHFSFYIFIFSGFIILWWLTGPVDEWYRYFLPAEWMLSLGIVSLIPALIKKKNRLASGFISLAIILLFVPQFSLSDIKKNLDDTGQKNLIMMKNYIQGIDERNIFAYGWFQCPQLMFLTNKRFQDYQNNEKLSQARREGREIFLVTSAENIHHIEDEMKEVTKSLKLVKEFGPNRLYKIEHNLE